MTKKKGNDMDNYKMFSIKYSQQELVIAVATFPDQPLISLSLVIGPLIELPLLSIISSVLLRWNNKKTS